MSEEEDHSISKLQFVGDQSDPVRLARLQERVRMMEETVGEFRGDLKEIKVAIKLVFSHLLKAEDFSQIWGVIRPVFWLSVGALVTFFIMHVDWL